MKILLLLGLCHALLSNGVCENIAANIINVPAPLGLLQQYEKSLTTSKLFSFIEESDDLLESSKDGLSWLLHGVKELHDNKETDVLSRECLSDLLLIYQIASKGGNIPQWIIKLIDATGKPESGILQGNTKWPGRFSECIDIQNAELPGINRTVNGTYYWGILSPKGDNIPFKVLQSIYIGCAVCVPQSCTAADLQSLLVSVLLPKLKKWIPQLPNTTSVSVIRKEASFDIGADGAAVASLVIISLFVLLLVVGTLYDVMVYQNRSRRRQKREPELLGAEDSHLIEQVNDEVVQQDGDDDRLLNIAPGDITYSEEYNDDLSLLGKILLCFSVFTNGEKILKLEHSPGSLQCVHGIRFLSMSWVLLCHVYVLGPTVLTDNLAVLPDVFNSFAFQVITNGFFSVDSFFVLSGLLVCYLYFKRLNADNERYTKLQKMKGWAYYYFHRYWRLTPVYMLCLGLISYSLSIYYTTSPFWATPDERFDQSCEKYWWRNLLYINNFFNASEMCFGHSWYLANDMQFYIISPIILVILSWKVYAGVILCFALIVSCWITTGIISSNHNLYVGMYGNHSMLQNKQNWFDIIYDKPYTRDAPYIIGILCGYLIYNHQGKVKLNRLLVAVLWFVAAGLNLTVVYGLYHKEQSVASSAAFNALSHSAWSLGLCWVIYACCTGHGGFVNTILSWKGFLPMSRLTYCMYLIHPIAIFAVYASRETTLHFTQTTMVINFFGCLLLSLFFAAVLSLMFEAPMIALEKVFIKKRR